MVTRIEYCKHTHHVCNNRGYRISNKQHQSSRIEGNGIIGSPIFGIRQNVSKSMH